MSVVGYVLKVDAAIAFAIGSLLYLLPHFFADALFQRKSDGVHWHLIRCVGGQIFASGFVSYRFTNASRPSQSVCHILRIVPSILLLALIYQCNSITPDLLPSNALIFLKYVMYITIIEHFVLLSIGKWIIGSRLCLESTFGNFLYQLDALASICIGAAWMTFPKWLLHKQVLVELDETHELCGRVMGALFISSYIVSTHALYWDSLKERNVAVDGRVLCCLSILGAQLWSQTYEAWSGTHWVGITLFSTWTVAALLYRLHISFKLHKD